MPVDLCHPTILQCHWNCCEMSLCSGMDSDLDWEGGVGPSSTPYHLVS